MVLCWKPIPTRIAACTGERVNEPAGSLWKYSMAIVGTKSITKWKSTKFFAYDSRRFKSNIVMCCSMSSRDTNFDADYYSVSIAAIPPDAEFYERATN